MSNPKFYGYLSEDDRGCDYTIGCGETLQALEAQTYEAALEEMRRSAVGHWDDEGEYQPPDFGDGVKIAYLIPAAAFEVIPLSEWKSQRDKELGERSKVAQREADLAEYARLQEKLGIDTQ